jgi:glycine cleavage system H protein
VELPEVGATLSQFAPFGVVESVKAVSDLFAPIAGEVLEVNDALRDAPELLNSDPFGEGWIARIALADPAELDVLMDADAYGAQTA